MQSIISREGGAGKTLPSAPTHPHSLASTWCSQLMRAVEMLNSWVEYQSIRGLLEGGTVGVWRA